MKVDILIQVFQSTLITTTDIPARTDWTFLLWLNRRNWRGLLTRCSKSQQAITSYHPSSTEHLTVMLSQYWQTFYLSQEWVTVVLSKNFSTVWLY